MMIKEMMMVMMMIQSLVMELIRRPFSGIIILCMAILYHFHFRLN